MFAWKFHVHLAGNGVETDRAHYGVHALIGWVDQVVQANNILNLDEKIVLSFCGMACPPKECLEEWRRLVAAVKVRNVRLQATRLIPPLLHQTSATLQDGFCASNQIKLLEAFQVLAGTAWAGMAGQHGQITADVMQLAAAADTAGSALAVHSFSSLLSQLIASSQVRAECADPLQLAGQLLVESELMAHACPAGLFAGQGRSTAVPPAPKMAVTARPE